MSGGAYEILVCRPLEWGPGRESPPPAGRFDIRANDFFDLDRQLAGGGAA